MEESDFAFCPLGVNQFFNWSCLERSTVFLDFTFAVLTLELVSTATSFIVLASVINGLENHKNE
jgi:hypothetical protein